ncbi:ABC transporter substrate-binding protein [Ramlibacter sp. H39-3-26]|uniref:ABC transporter substrate-binding protein n=1 Tax=Curvibacter soli TaxID=3031331 RepID=UPI0023D98D95|nr:ABC transporter substrate-binding protein [Ramlibacter sp. H39-3-26]MDF1485077.1 ABC transporter substrate-binding protein [Ramlibacter sp. H39-3-26]
MLAGALPLSGPNAGPGRAYAAGMRLYFEQVNKAGGANGAQITLVTKDDGGRSDDTLAATKQMLAESKPLALAGYFGNRNTSILADGAAAGGFIEQYRMNGGTAQLFANSDCDLEFLQKRLSESHMAGLSIAQVVPNPYKITTRLSKELRDAIARSQAPDTPVSYAMMEGYINAKVIAEAARRMGPRASREAFTAAMEGLDGFDAGGYPVSLRTDPRVGAHVVEMSIVNAAGRLRQ